MGWPLILELGALFVGFVVFFLRMSYVSKETRNDVREIKDQIHDDNDKQEKLLNEIVKEQAVAKEAREGIKADLKEIKRKQNGK